MYLDFGVGVWMGFLWICRKTLGELRYCRCWWVVVGGVILLGWFRLGGCAWCPIRLELAGVWGSLGGRVGLGMQRLR
jgi:hypothetical protein